MENNGTLMGEEKDNRKVDGSFLILNFITFTRGAWQLNMVGKKNLDFCV